MTSIISLRKISWTTESITIRTLLTAFKEDTYDINPPHQRGVVHDQEWKDDLLDSILGPLNAIPETWWHPRNDVTGCEYYESLDGKQRTTTIVAFGEGEIPWRGKMLSELTQQEKNAFYNFKLTHRVANRSLTNDEVARMFQKFQNHKKTTLGEILHSHRDNLTTQMETLIQSHAESIDSMGIKSNRYQSLEAYGKALDYYLRGSGTISCETDTVCATWSTHKQGIPETDLLKFKTNMSLTWTSFTLPNQTRVPRKMNIGTWLPVFALFCETPDIQHAELSIYLNDNLNIIVEDDVNWPKVGGNHNIMFVRKDNLKVLFNSQTY